MGYNPILLVPPRPSQQEVLVHRYTGGEIDVATFLVLIDQLYEEGGQDDPWPPAAAPPRADPALVRQVRIV